jgi:hypothetical protein
LEIVSPVACDALVTRVARMIPRKEVGWIRCSSCDFVTPTFFRKCVSKWQCPLRKNIAATLKPQSPDP